MQRTHTRHVYIISFTGGLPLLQQLCTLLVHLFTPLAMQLTIIKTNNIRLSCRLLIVVVVATTFTLLLVISCTTTIITLIHDSYYKQHTTYYLVVVGIDCHVVAAAAACCTDAADYVKPCGRLMLYNWVQCNIYNLQ